MKLTPVTRGGIRASKFRELVDRAIGVACVARGEAQWMNGYRAGSGDRDETLYYREMEQWKLCGDREDVVRRLLDAWEKEMSKRNQTRRKGHGPKKKGKKRA